MPPEVAEILHKTVDKAGSNRSWRRRCTAASRADDPGRVRQAGRRRNRKVAQAGGSPVCRSTRQAPRGE